MFKRCVVASLALAAFLVPAVSQAGKARTETGEYNTFTVDTDQTGPSASGRISNGVSFTPRRGERYVSVVIEDKTGVPVRAFVEQDVDDDGQADLSVEFCGATSEPIRFQKGAPVEVWAQEGPCADNSGGASTFGTVTATFTR